MEEILMIGPFLDAVVQIVVGFSQWILPWISGIPITTGLAAIALIGYLFGRSQVKAEREAGEHLRKQAEQSLSHVHNLTSNFRDSLALQHQSIEVFRNNILSLNGTDNPQLHEQVAQQAERILQPAIEFSSKMDRTFEQLRNRAARLKAANQPLKSSIESTETRS